MVEGSYGLEFLFGFTFAHLILAFVLGAFTVLYLQGWADPGRILAFLVRSVRRIMARVLFSVTRAVATPDQRRRIVWRPDVVDEGVGDGIADPPPVPPPPAPAVLIRNPEAVYVTQFGDRYHLNARCVPETSRRTAMERRTRCLMCCHNGGGATGQ